MILPSSALEKGAVLAEERRRQRARLTGDPPPLLSPRWCSGLHRAVEHCRLSDRKQLAFDELKWCLGLSHTPQDAPQSGLQLAPLCSTSHQGEVVEVLVVWGGGGVQTYRRS